MPQCRETLPAEWASFWVLPLESSRDKLKHGQREDLARKGLWSYLVGEKTEGCLAWRREGLETGHLFLIICRLVKWKVIRFGDFW